MTTLERLEQLIDAAKQHGEDSDPDHEAGDLQDLLRCAFGLMTETQRHLFLTSDTVHNQREIMATDNEDWMRD